MKRDATNYASLALRAGSPINRATSLRCAEDLHFREDDAILRRIVFATIDR